MITVTIYRDTLARHRACAEGLALYDQIAALQPESDARTDCITIADWTRLHSVWPYVAGYGRFARWLEAHGIIPRADFSGVNLSGVDLSRADLSGANISHANISRVDLSGADLSRADLSGANLFRVDLSGANLSGANLSGANLLRVDLSGAYLSGANLSGVDLYGANLSGAYLSGAYRGASPAIPGWRTLATGYLERWEETASALEVCPSEALLPWDEDDQALADGRSVETQHRTNEARRKLVDAVAGVRATDREEIARATVRAVVADLRLAVETMRRTADDMRRQNHGWEIEVYDRADALEKAAEYIEEEALERIVGAASTDTSGEPKEG